MSLVTFLEKPTFSTVSGNHPMQIRLDESPVGVCCRAPADAVLWFSIVTFSRLYRRAGGVCHAALQPYRWAPAEGA